ncbi:MAG: hypothetical protein AAGF96_14940 [Bacteroidota bacterium]
MMKLNRTIGVVGLVFLFSLGTFAQGPVRDRIKTLKVAFITERLELTSAEAQDFWPVYNAYEEKVEALRKKERLRFGSQLPYLDELSENEAAKLLTEYTAIQTEKQKNESNFLNDLRTVLPSKKIVLLLKAEEDFKKRLLQQVRKRRGG